MAIVIRRLCGILLIIFVISARGQKLQKLLPKDDPSETVAAAISDIVREFFIANDIRFDFIIYGKSSTHIDDTINDVKMKISQEIVSTKLINIPSISTFDHLLNQSAIIFIKSRKDLDLLHIKSSERYNTYRVGFQFTTVLLEKLKFLVYVQEMNRIEDFHTKIRKAHVSILKLPTDVRHFEFIITKNKNLVKLYAKVLYSEQKCDVFQHKQLNIFNGTTQKWIKPLQNFDHFSNYHGCNVSVYGSLHSSADKGQKILNDVYLDKNIGVLNKIMEMTAKRLNFTLDVSNFVRDKSNQIGLSIGPFYYSNDHDPGVSSDLDRWYNYIPISINYDFFFLLTLNDLYTNYEKLVLPFDFITWVLLLFTFGMTFGVIIGLQMGPKWLKVLVIGKDVNNPGYNALGIFFGISQMRLPQSNFSRILLLLFLWFCLMFRTCYQSMMFEFMTSDMRKPLPKNIEELIKYNYTVLLNRDALNDLNGLITTPGFYIQYSLFDRYFTQLKNSKIAYSQQNFFKTYQKELVNKTGKKYAFYINKLLHARLNATFKNTLPVMEKEKLSQDAMIVMMKHNILFAEVSKTVKQLSTTGITEHLYKYNLWCLYRPSDVEIEDPRRILSMTDLEFGFVIWLFCCLLSFLVFMIECRSLWIKRMLRKLIGLIDFLKVLKARLSDYHDRW